MEPSPSPSPNTLPQAAGEAAAGGWRGLLTLVALILAGMVGNYFQFTIFHTADFVYGSVFAVLALQCFGLRRGIVASLVVSLPLLYHWGHAYPLLFMTAEVAVVGWLNRRWRIGWVQADALYWVFLGMPLVLGTLHAGLGLPIDRALFLMVKVAVNGLANVLLARLLFLGFRKRSRQPRTGYREALFNLLALFVLGPGLAMIALDSRQDLRAMDAQMRSTLLQEGRRAASRVGGDPGASPARLLEEVRRDRAGNPLGFSLLDQDGRVLVTNRAGQSLLAPLSRPAGALTRLDGQVSQWLPDLQPNLPVVDQWSRANYVAAFPVGAQGWSLVLEQPVAPFQGVLFAAYSRQLAMLLLMVLAALAVAEVASRRIARAFEELALLTHNLPLKLAAPEADLSWPVSGILEASELITNFRTMADTLTAQFQRIRLDNETLEQRVAARTRALEESEAKFRVVFEKAPLGMAIVDSASGRILSANQRLGHILGYAPGDLVGRSYQSLTHPDQVAEDLASVRELASGAVPEIVKENRFVHRSGAQVWARLRMVLLPGSPGEPVLHLSLVEDITERRRAKAALHENEIRTRKAESLVLMAGSIAHDFNNLFQALVSSLGIVEFRCRHNPSVLQPLGTAQEVLRRAIALSWKMLDFSGRANARLKSHPLPAIVSAWAAGLDRGRYGGALEVAADDVPLVRADPEKLDQVLDNLLDNAKEAMDTAGVVAPRISLKVFVAFGSEGSITEAPGLWVTDPPALPATVCLEFANAGPAPGPEVLRRMFDPFFSTKALGRGLGLPSALGILQAHGASVQVLPEADPGLAFRIHFPPVGA